MTFNSYINDPSISISTNMDANGIRQCLRNGERHLNPLRYIFKNFIGSNGRVINLSLLLGFTTLRNHIYNYKP